MRHFFRPLCAGIVTLLSVLPDESRLHAGTLTVENTSEFSSGRYGEPQTTDELYEAISGKYEFGDTLLKLTIPWLYVVGPADVIPDFGSATNTMNMRRTTRTGMGDITARVEQEVSPDSWQDTELDLIGKVKFGTASFSRGLGTGENDYYAQVEWTQHFPYEISTVADVGRRFVESSAETGLHDTWYGGFGAIWRADPATSVSAWLDLRQSAASSSGNGVEATLQASNSFAPGWKATVYGTKGFAPGSANLTAGLILARAFSL